MDAAVDFRQYQRMDFWRFPRTCRHGVLRVTQSALRLRSAVIPAYPAALSLRGKDMNLNWLRKTLRPHGEDGQDMVEYALILGMVSITAIAIILLVGPAVKDEFQYIVNGLASA